MPNLDPDHVHATLRRLAKSRVKVFGADVHGFILNPPLSEPQTQDIEQRHNIRLPEDYRHFITQIGNGGAGPDYGLFPFGYMDDVGTRLQRWSERDGFVGVLSQPFRFAEPWNDLSGLPGNELPNSDEEQTKYDQQMSAFEQRYWSGALMHGAFPICHRGCAIRIWLVVAGTETGHLWHDGRADFSGLSPLLLQDGSRATFSSWYSQWLGQAMTGMPS